MVIVLFFREVSNPLGVLFFVDRAEAEREVSRDHRSLGTCSTEVHPRAGAEAKHAAWLASRASRQAAVAAPLRSGGHKDSADAPPVLPGAIK